MKRASRVRVGNLVSVPGTITWFTYWFPGDEEAGSRDMSAEAHLEKGQEKVRKRKEVGEL